MPHTKIAIAKPFEGAPKINMCDHYGASPGKPILLKIPVTGQRPINYTAENLPDGLRRMSAPSYVTGCISRKSDTQERSTQWQRAFCLYVREKRPE